MFLALIAKTILKVYKIHQQDFYIISQITLGQFLFFRKVKLHTFPFLIHKILTGYNDKL